MAPSTPSPPPRTPKKHYSPHKRARIAALQEAGWSQRKIARHEGISPGSISGILKRYRVQKSAKSLERSGRPRILGPRDVRYLLRFIAQDPFITCEELQEKANLECSVRTIQRELIQQGIQHSKALRRPKLTPETAEKRLTFARLHVRKPASWWRRWIFSDESTIQRGDGERQKWVFCRAGERLKPENVQPKGKPTRHSQMFWAAFNFRHGTSLVPMMGDPESPRGGVTGRVVLACLQENLPTICEPGSIFAQDNAPTHKARIVQEWLQPWAAENGIGLVDWPPYSPDLNPIENLWKMLKEGICERYPDLGDMPKNQAAMDRLVQAAVEVWEDFQADLFTRLVDSMVRRLEAVIEANGWYTKY